MGRKDSGYKNINKKNVRMAVIVFAVGMILAGVLFVKNKGNDTQPDVLVREENGKTTSVKLKAETKFGEENIDLDILSRINSEEEIEEMKKGFIDALKICILSNNASFERIDSDLNFVPALDGYPFEIEYKVRPRGILDSEGRITQKIEENTEIEIEITYSLEEYEETEVLTGIVVPPPMSESEEFSEKIESFLNNLNENDRVSKTITLPDKIDGVNIKWSQNHKSKSSAVILMTILISGVFLFKDRITMDEDEKKRRETIISDYSEFAVKYALLNEAGLTHRQIVERLGEEYEKNKKNSPLYAELYKVNTDVKGGVPLTEALDTMARNCGVRDITHFVSLINRNIKKGGKDIASEIKKAAAESTNERREMVRRKAETAGTRLLIPMVFLLIIVFVLIMVPAFDSFSF